MTRAALCVLALLSCNAAHAINVCTDAAGRTSIQDQPCMLPAASGKNEPVAATALTPEVAADTVKRFSATLQSRDVVTATRFLAPSFKASLQTDTGQRWLDRQSFTRLLSQSLTAARTYEVKSSCAKPVAVPQGFEVTCETRDTLTLLSKQLGSESTETHTVVLIDGVARFASIKSRQHGNTRAGT